MLVRDVLRFVGRALSRDTRGVFVVLHLLVYMVGVLLPLAAVGALGWRFYDTLQQRHIERECLVRMIKQATAERIHAEKRLQETVEVLKRQTDHVERLRKTGVRVGEQESALREFRQALEHFPTSEGLFTAP
jgi:hypothetical protein